MSSFKKLHRKEYAKLNSLILKSKCQKITPSEKQLLYTV